MSRREFSKTVRWQALKRCTDAKGIPHCEGCGAELTGPGTNYDHDTPDGLGGEPTLANCKVLCRACHKIKTHGHDNPIMQKADRVRKKAFGIKKRSTFAGSRDSKFKKRMDGTVVLR